MYSLALIIFVVSEKKAFEHFPLTLDPMGKYSNAFFSETTNMIKAKLYMNVHWMVLYKLQVFCSDMKFKMAATAGLRNRNLVKDIPMIILVQFGFSQFISFREEDL
jgi:hypothetical protein